LNLARNTNFSFIDSDKLLSEAARSGWEIPGIEILVNELNANLESMVSSGKTPLLCAANYGNDKVVKTLIALKSNLNAVNSYGKSALHCAAWKNQESCIRILLDAGLSTELKTFHGDTALDTLMKFHPDNERIKKLLQGHDVPPLKKISKKSVVSIVDQLKTAAVEGTLTSFFDTHNVPHSLVCKLLGEKDVAIRIENTLQVLWFGGHIEQETLQGYTGLRHAAKSGPLVCVDAFFARKCEG
jgi:hypothetical protein